MKFSLQTEANQRAISSARSQIKNSEDLRKFDTFLAKHKVIDFADAELANSAKASCFGEYCCQYVTVEPHISVV